MARRVFVDKANKDVELLVRALATSRKAATASGGAVTQNEYSGRITTAAISTAAAGVYVLTITNNKIAAGDRVSVSVDQNGSTGLAVLSSIEPASGSVVIRIANLHASAAFNAALVVDYDVIKDRG